MDCKDCVLGNCDSIMSDLKMGDLEKISKNKTSIIYKKRQNINVQGNLVFGVYTVCSGKLKVYTTNVDGKESIIRIAGPGDIVGFRSFFSGELFQATITALETSKVCFFSKDEIQRIMKHHPDVTNRLVVKLSKMLGAAEKNIASLMQDPVKKTLC